MRIIHVAAELAPCAKVGGLGDVVQGLAHELVRQGHDVEVILPAYPHLIDKPPSLPFTLTLLPHPLFQRPHIYGYDDDVQRFAHFSSLAAKHIASQSYDVIHLHDWHTALIAAYLPRTILTLHNLAYMGTCDPLLLQELGITLDSTLQGSEGYSLLRVGIVKATQITTVSPTYACEILTSDYGYSLCELLQRSQYKLHGILNGLDTDYWNPATDPYLPVPYDATHLDGKYQSQRHILQELGLIHEKGPLVAAITRLVWQKGPDLIAAAIEKTLLEGGTFMLLGSTADAVTEATFYALRERFPTNRLHMTLHFDEALAHKIYAAADLLIIPSRFEPCGLTQLIAMRYGTLPLVRHTGGLADTVQPGTNGFTFEAPDIHACLSTLQEAFTTWDQATTIWKEMQRHALTADYSWQRSAHAYLTVYSGLKTYLTHDIVH